MDAQSMILHLKELFDKEGLTERYEISKELVRCKMAESSSVRPHMLKMIGLIERLGQLGLAMDHELTTLPELLNMLDMAERSIRKDKGSLLLVSSSKAHTKQQNKKAQKGKKGPKIKMSKILAEEVTTWMDYLKH
ncbi:Uncharacterized protein TCM_022766 [Theobroma cacao]|uniref:Zinc finger, CCHC-type n=1 Tax=Theobroma cacao TaxID=3641 RepID=A0A061EVE4_THECC|nr:Uncharacterized protein TCM_022766 [Theobroma cacao]